jgi:hypothetical protein
MASCWCKRSSPSGFRRAAPGRSLRCASTSAWTPTKSSICSRLCAELSWRRFRRTGLSVCTARGVAPGLRRALPASGAHPCMPLHACLGSPGLRNAGVDRLGNSYYYNKYTMKVINSHPLSELYLDWIAASRQQKAEETELKRKDALEDEEIEEDMGTPWMRFATEDGGEGMMYWFNFQIRKLYTEPQYKHILELELEERAEAAQKQQKPDPKKEAEKELEMKMKKAAEKFFASGLRKFWLKWQLHMMELRNAQAKALVKSGVCPSLTGALGMCRVAAGIQVTGGRGSNPAL